jgi:hypothetical protein
MKTAKTAVNMNQHDFLHMDNLRGYRPPGVRGRERFPRIEQANGLGIADPRSGGVNQQSGISRRFPDQTGKENQISHKEKCSYT